ncbi:23S rRNA (pseudouridine(1915)-N(3))-methyltransferase RlmH [Allofustis seminis]|uniref:23S rRNA (pseudouridine(1915)-N(3))-methyltransferase RlmH n=1 Tax=Allofustis seminis TaxID=166939 RepID=UPI000476D0E1|nr:23S rRNA (pseudouridine(1915)-N(3))-methyltransferase RlmH [Allofustis seminis]
MKILCIVVGKLKEDYLCAGIAEYTKRLRPYCQLEVVEIPDEPTPQNASEKEERQIKEREGAKIIEKIPEHSYTIALDLHGKMLTSEEFAQMLQQQQDFGSGHITLIIGGSLGLSEAVIKRANDKIAFGRLTYPHQLMRLILHEQLYRAFKIMRGEPYHK